MTEVVVTLHGNRWAESNGQQQLSQSGAGDCNMGQKKSKFQYKFVLQDVDCRVSSASILSAFSPLSHSKREPKFSFNITSSRCTGPLEPIVRASEFFRIFDFPLPPFKEKEMAGKEVSGERNKSTAPKAAQKQTDKSDGSSEMVSFLLPFFLLNQHNFSLALNLVSSVTDNPEELIRPGKKHQPANKSASEPGYDSKYLVLSSNMEDGGMHCVDFSVCLDLFQIHQRFQGQF